MSIIYKSRVKVTATNKPNTVTAFNMPGSAATGFRTPSAAGYANGDSISYHATNGTDWESGIGTFNTGTPNTVARTTILESSNSDSTVDFSTGADVTFFVEWPSSLAASAGNTSLASLTGILPAYNSTSALDISAGSCVIGNKLYDLAATTVTSGTTMKDLAGATVTLGANKAYFVYAYLNSGALEIRIQERTGTGNGADPTYDSTKDYYKGPVTDSRRIGKIFTNGSSQIISFKVIVHGRTRIMMLATSGVGVTLVNYGTATTYTAVTVTPYITADDIAYYLELQSRRDTTNGRSQILWSSDGGVAEFLNLIVGEIPAGTAFGAFINRVPNTGTYHYKMFSSCSGYIRLLGVEHIA